MRRAISNGINLSRRYNLAQCPGVAPRVVEAGGLQALLQMQKCEREEIRRLAVKCLSTLTAAG